jgi:hypothetical protein
LLARVSEWLYSASTGKVAAVSILVFVVFTALVLPAQSRAAGEYSSGVGSPDMSFFYSSEELTRIAEAYGESGRAAYVRARFTFDLIWPIVYAFFLATTISWTFQRVFPPSSVIRRGNLLPLAAALFDYLENIATSIVMLRYPNSAPLLGNLAPVFTLLKWSLIVGSFGLLLFAGILLLWNGIYKLINRG